MPFNVGNGSCEESGDFCFLTDTWRRTVLALWNGFGILQTGFAMLLIRISSSIDAGSPNPEIPICFAGIANLLGMLKHSKFTLNVAFFVRHQNFLHQKLGNLQEVSRRSVHIYNGTGERYFVLTARAVFTILLLPTVIGLFSHTDLTDRINPGHASRRSDTFRAPILQRCRNGARRRTSLL